MKIILSKIEARVIGCLLEKEITTPEQYPLSLNALTAACNQKSNRDPVMSLSEAEVQSTLDVLKSKHMIGAVSGQRVIKYKHRFCNMEFKDLQFDQKELAVVCVLLLRGPQTSGELRTRTQRLCKFANVSEVETILSDLATKEVGALVVRLSREAGKRECRYAHLFSGEPDDVCKDETELRQDTFESKATQCSEDRIATLEARVAILEQLVENLKMKIF